MSPFPLHLSRRDIAKRASRRSFALVITLGLVAVATILLILFVTAMSLDRSASASYSQSVKAQEIGLGGLHIVVGQLQAEMSKDAPPDSGSGGTYLSIYTNVSSINIIPQANVTNSALPTLVKMSTNAPFFAGTSSSSFLQATTNSSTTSSYNGRSVSLTRWNQAYFGLYPTANSAPYWVLMNRSGPTNAAGIGFGPTGATLNNTDPANTNYTVGRIAYAVYDEGGLLDITTAGYNTNLINTPTALQPIKGTLAGADLSQLGIDPMKFVTWRNAATSTSVSSYVNYITGFATTNAFQQVYPGDTTFLGRQDLIAAAQDGTAGIPTSTLTNLTTFSRELNVPSWAPSINGTAATKYKYANNATAITTSPFTATQGVNKSGGENPNPFVPLVRYSVGGTVTGYLASGASYTYTVNVGDPLVQHRFPLDRLNWITPTGPAAGISAAAIQACFGLIWGAAENKTSGGDTNWTGIKVWKYVGPTLATETQITSATISPIETLSDVAKEATPREPNFFELLQAGVLSGSLGINLGATSNFQFMSNVAQTYPSFQLLRVGASVISQAQGSAYPINIEYNQQGYSFVASGVANLPYLNALKFVEGVDLNTTGTSTTSLTPMATYGLIGLWNPHQQSATAVTRPNVRLYVQGSVTLASGWIANTPPAAAVASVANAYGITYTMAANTYIQLNNTAGSGGNGFLNPFAVTAGDVSTTVVPSPAYTTGGTQPGWTSSTSALTYQSTTATYPDASVTYEALRFPNVNLTLAQTGNGIPGNSAGTPELTSLGQVHFSTLLGGPALATVTPATAAPIFQMIMKYQDPNDITGATWVPYDYWVGNSSWATWWSTFGMSGPTIAPAYTGSGSSATVTGPPYFTLPTVDQTMHAALVANAHTGNQVADARFHSGLMLNPDPRVSRFGIFPLSGDDGTATTGVNGTIANPMIDSIWSGGANTTAPFNICGYGGGGSGAPSTTPAIPSELNTVPTNFKNWFLPAYLSRNNTAYPNVAGGSTGTYFTAYQDPDGIQRIGDSGLFPTTGITGAPTAGNPYYDPNNKASTTGQRTADRPIVLNRPYASVGELGYVCRDDPWRSLDFFSTLSGTSTSADSGLLDLFTVTDSPNTVVAGHVNLNTQNTVVLTAILNNTLANAGDAVNNTGVTSLSNASAMATALATYTAAHPLANKDQLVTQFAANLSSGTTLGAAFGSADEQNVKTYREAFVRSLGDVGQTRTWNLMIDLVAQAGRYPPTATSNDQFVVEGERRYWLHVAIDRITGQVVDQRLEVVAP